MKKILLILFCFPCLVLAQKTYVPDDVFEQELINQGYDNVLDDSVLTANINTLIFLDVNSTFHFGTLITDLTGIEDFTNLETLWCRSNSLVELNLSNNINLMQLICGYNDFITLDLSGNPNLASVNVRDCPLLTTVNVSTSNAYWLSFYAMNNPSLMCIDVSDHYGVVSQNSDWDVPSGVHFCDGDLWITYTYGDQYSATLYLVSSGCNSCSDEIGCTDPNACNYNPGTSIDDGSCIFVSVYPISSTPTSCHGASDGSISVTAYGGTPPYQYSLNGSAYQSNGNFTGLSSGTYYVDVIDSVNCPLSSFTSVQVSSPSQIVSFVTVTACYSYVWDGVSYYNTGLYTNVYTDVNGCDSTVNLNLTIQYSQTSSVSVTVCDSYVWDGVSYDTTGLFTNVYTDVNGCDSTVTLDLTIKNSSLSTFSATACGFYFWDGIRYYTTGLYTNAFTGFNGCDSIVNLELTINNAESSTIWQTGNELFAITFNNNSIEADWYNIQIQNEVTRIWLMQEQSSSFIPNFDCSYFLIYEDDFGCIDTSSVYYYSENAKRIGTIITSPNPTSNIFKAQFDNPKNQNVKLELINSNGIKLDEFFTTYDNLEIDLSKYPSGTYYLYFNSEDTLQGCRFEELQKISSKIILKK